MVFEWSWSKMGIVFYLFYFHFIYSWLKITLYTQKSLYSLYSNNIELIEVNSVTEQEMQSFPKEFLKSMWTWKMNVKLADIHAFVHTFIKEILKEAPPFLCIEFSGVHCVNPHFLLEILKDCDNLILLGTRSHIFAQRNEMDSMPCLMEFTLRLCNVSFRPKLYGRETGKNRSFKMGGEKPCETL